MAQTLRRKFSVMGRTHMLTVIAHAQNNTKHQPDKLSEGGGADWTAVVSSYPAGRLPSRGRIPRGGRGRGSQRAAWSETQGPHGRDGLDKEGAARVPPRAGRVGVSWQMPSPWRSNLQPRPRPRPTRCWPRMPTRRSKRSWPTSRPRQIKVAAERRVLPWQMKLRPGRVRGGRSCGFDRVHHGQGYCRGRVEGGRGCC